MLFACFERSIWLLHLFLFDGFIFSSLRCLYCVIFHIKFYSPSKSWASNAFFQTNSRPRFLPENPNQLHNFVQRYIFGWKWFVGGWWLMKKLMVSCEFFTSARNIPVFIRLIVSLAAQFWLRATKMRHIIIDTRFFQRKTLRNLKLCLRCLEKFFQSRFSWQSFQAIQFNYCRFMFFATIMKRVFCRNLA